MIKKLFISLFVIILLPLCSYGADRVYFYGFEDWGGTIADTPDYPFTTNSSEYCTAHEAATEVVSSYDGLNPATGSYFLLVNMAPDYALSPSQSGITAGAANPRLQWGFDGTYCGLETWDVDTITSNKLFIRFKLATQNGMWSNMNSSAQLKMINVPGDTCTDEIIAVYTSERVSSIPTGGGSCPGTFSSASSILEFDDGHWHEISALFDWDSGVVYYWHDKWGEETVLNYDLIDNRIDGTGPNSVLAILENWSAFNPTGEFWFAVDDMEIWDGFPTGDPYWTSAPISINNSATPGATSSHYNSGGRRIVRIDNTVIALAPEVDTADHMWRSTDGGTTWAEIDDAGSNSFSGTLITGKDNYVYHFYNNGTNLYMVKFLYDGTPGSPTTIAATGSSAADKSVNATVDSNGKLYVVGNWGSPDHIYMYTSTDEGSNWNGPYDVSNGTPYYYAHVEVTSGGLLVCAYAEAGDSYGDLWFAKSSNGGVSWSQIEIGDGNATTLKYGNPAILTVGEGDLYVFGQGGGPSGGLIFNHSNDQGDTWDGWVIIEATQGSSKYADPSPALGSDGTIYVAYRNDSAGDDYEWREHLAASDDGGSTWTVVDNYDDADDRVGTRSQIRYQTWFNYGGLLEWIWMQGDPYDTQNEIYYDSNSGVSIMNEVSEPGGTSISSPKNFRGVLQ